MLHGWPPSSSLTLKMVETHDFHQSIKEYSAQGKQNLFPVLYGCPNPCCVYEGMLHRHAFYNRNALALTGTLLSGSCATIARSAKGPSLYCPLSVLLTISE